MRTDKKRVGLLVPSSNTIMENDLHNALDKSLFSVHTARMFLVKTLREAELEMIERHAPIAAKDLGTVSPDIVIFGCTSGASLGGNEYDRTTCAKLGELAGAPTISALAAINEALNRRDFRSLAVVTPYVADLAKSVASAAEANSRKVVFACGMEISDNARLAEPTPAQIIEFAMHQLSGKSFDGVLVPCTNFRALEARAELERRLEVPVITSNSAIIEAVETRFSLAGG